MRPHAFCCRRVVDLAESYWLVCKRYTCKTCKRLHEVDSTRRYSFAMWDPLVLAKYHGDITERLDVLFTHKCAVSQALADYIEDHATTAASFAAMHKYICANHHRACDRARLRYGLEVQRWNRNAKALNIALADFEPWGEFNDREGWSGYVPCAAYFVAVFLQAAEEKGDFMRKCIQMVDANILSGDASMKVPKLIRIDSATQYKKFLYTLMNEHGQIVGFWFVDQDSAAHLTPKFNAVNKRWDLHGTGGPLIAYGDNCCGKDRGLFTASFPSLNGTAVSQQQKENEEASSLKVRKLKKATLAQLGCDNNITVIQSRLNADHLASRILVDDDIKSIGLDGEWTATPGNTAHSRVDCLQLCVPSHGENGTAKVYLLDMGAICKDNRSLPRGLLQLLQSEQKIFVGNNIQGDLTRLGNHHDCDLGFAKSRLRPANIMDTSAMATELKPEDARYRRQDGRRMGTIKLELLVADFLNLQLEKGANSARVSTWDSTKWSNEQKMYAAIDVAASLALYTKLAQHLDVVGRGLALGFKPGDNVSLLLSGHTACAANGVVTETCPEHEAHGPQMLSVVVHINDICAPGALCLGTSGGSGMMSMGDVVAESPDKTRFIFAWKRIDVRMHTREDGEEMRPGTRVYCSPLSLPNVGGRPWHLNYEVSPELNLFGEVRASVGRDQWQVQLDFKGIDVLLTSDQLACAIDADGARGTEGANAAEEAGDTGDGGGEDPNRAADGEWEAAFWDANRKHPKQWVLLDALHAMKRVRDTIPTNHTLRDRFMSRLRDILFAVSDADVTTVMKELLDSGWKESEVIHLYETNYRYFVRRVRRTIPAPQILLPDLARLVTLYTPTRESPHRGFCPHTKTFLLGKDSTMDKLKSLRHHISEGCLSDPENVSLYVNVGSPEKLRLHCMRGTSPLEGFHQHIIRFYSGHTTSPRLAHSLLTSFVYRWNQQRHISRKGGVDHGHEDLWLMHRIHHVERKIAMEFELHRTDIGVRGLVDVEAYEDSKESFGFGTYEQLTEDAIDAEIKLFIERHSVDIEGHFAQPEDTVVGLSVEEVGLGTPAFEGDLGQWRTNRDLGAANGEEDARSEREATAANLGPTAGQRGIIEGKLREALASLKPSSRWLALKEGLWRPTLTPSKPTDVELDAAREIRRDLEGRGLAIGGAPFRQRFQEEWTKVCHDMATGKRDDTGIGLIAPGSYDTFMKMYEKWVDGVAARKEVREADRQFEAELRSPERDVAMRALHVSALTTDGCPTVSITKQVTKPGAPIAMQGVGRSGIYGVYNLAAGLSGVYDQTAGLTSLMPVSKDASAAPSSRAKMCYVCGWPLTGGPHPHHRDKKGCMLAPDERNPAVFKVRKDRAKNYKNWCKTHGMVIDFGPERAN